MTTVVVCGGGMIGLASAMMLARDGYAVTVLETDPGPPATVDEVWSDWSRSGVPQFRQPHNLFPRFQSILDAELPDLVPALEAAGCPWVDPLTNLPPSVADRSPRPGDERFRFLTGRRPVVEAVVAAAAAAEPGVTVRRGVTLSGLLVDTDETPPRVVGVGTRDSEEVRGDLVVDAMGRSSPVAGWVAGLGIAPHTESQDRGFAYYTRYYAGPLPERRAPGLAPIGSMSVLTLAGDNDTYSVTLFGTTGDPVLKRFRDAEVFTRVISACPAHAHWVTQGEPITGVLPMAGVLDRLRRYVVDDRPLVSGLLAVGDAWASTNPSAGRGLSVGLMHARALRHLLRDRPPVDAGLTVAWDEVTEAEVTPYFRAQELADHHRVAEMDAVRERRPGPPPHPGVVRLLAAAMHDADAFRALLEVALSMDLPLSVLARPGLAPILARYEGVAPPTVPGPSRDELEALAA